MSVFHLTSDVEEWPDSPHPAALRTPATAEVSALLRQYLSVTEAAGVEPLLSLMTFFRFYGIVLGWEFGVILLPVIAIINAIVWLISKFRRTASTPRYLPAWGWSWTVRAAKSLHRGEIPLLKFFVNRNLVRLFALLHIRGRIRELAVGARLRYVAATISHDAAKAAQANADGVLLDAASSGLSRRAELKLLLLLLPAIQLLAIMLKALGGRIEVSWASVVGWLGIGPTRFDMRAAHFQRSGHLFPVLILISYVLMFVVSCFIRKRELFRQYAIYEAERGVATATYSTLSRELPLDLTGWVLVVALAIVPSFLREFDLIFTTTMAGVYAAPFIYALVRRYLIAER